MFDANFDLFDRSPIGTDLARRPGSALATRSRRAADGERIDWYSPRRRWGFRRAHWALCSLWSQNVFDKATKIALIVAPGVGVQPPCAPVDQRGRHGDPFVGS
jgi:hypothetical protein